MKGLNYVKLGLFLIPIGFVSPFLFLLFDFLWNFYLIGEIAISTLVTAEVLGVFLIFYGRRQSKRDFTSKLQEVMKEKGKVTPSDLEQIEREVFGSVISFGSVRLGWIGAHDLLLADDCNFLKVLWVTERVEEVMENGNL